MHFPRSFVASAIVLSFSASVDAAVAQERADSAHSNNYWPLKDLFAKRQEPETTDSFVVRNGPEWRVLSNADPEDTKLVCNKLIGPLDPTTITVDYTPAATTRTNTILRTRTRRRTTRTIVTETEYIVADRPTLVARAINAAAIAQAQDVFNSFLVAQTTESAPAASNTERAEVIAQMSSACRALDVDPTSTMTETFTAPPSLETVTEFSLTYETVWQTIFYTNTVFQLVNRAANQTVNGTIPAGATIIAGSSTFIAPSSGIPVDASATPTSEADSTASLSSTILAETDAPVATGLPDSIVEGIPFSCPDDDGQRITNIVGDKRYEYEVLCYTGAVQTDPILTKQVAGETECAAACSLYNGGSGRDACLTATYTAGSCVLSGEVSAYLPSNGTITLLHTATYGAGDASGKCILSESENATATVSIDTASLKASLITADLSISTPGFVTGTTVGGASSTRIWFNTTAADGSVNWSVQDIYVSSASWFNVYETAWSCATVYAQTIVVPPVGNTTSVPQVTTIINGRAITVINGSYTSTFTQDGSGASPPTSVEASTTSEEAPSTTLPSTPTATAQISGSSGAAQFTESGASTTLNGTNGFGSLSPSVASSQVIETISSATSVSNVTQGSGSGDATDADTTVTATITTEVTTIITASDSALNATSGSFVGTISSAVNTFNSTGDSGSGLVSSATPSSTAGEGNFTVTGGTTISSNGGSAGVVNASRTSSIVSTRGLADLTVSDATATTLVSGTGGVIAPANSTLTGVPSSSATSGAQNFTISDATATTIVIGTGGVIGPVNSTITDAPTSSATTGAQNLTVSDGTAVTIVSSTDGVIPPATSSITEALGSSATAGSQNNTVSGGTAVTSVTGANGVISNTPLPSSNVSTPVDIPSASVTSGSSNFTVPGETAVTSIGGASGTTPPPSNSTTEATSVTPFPSFDESSTVVEFTTPGAANFSTAGGTVVTIIDGTGGVIRPSSNASVTVPPSLTAMPSLNASLTTRSFTFTNDDDLRSRGSRSSTLNSTAAAGSGTAPPPSSAAPNSTAVPSFVAPPDYSAQSSVLTPPIANLTSAPGSGQPSVTAPPPSLNVTSTPPANSTDFAFSLTEGPREPGSRSFSLPLNTTEPPIRVPVGTRSSSIPPASANTTASAVLPPVSTNGTVPVISTGYSPATTAGSASVTIPGSIAVPTASSNATSIAPTGGTASLTISGSSNTTSIGGTGSWIIPTPSSNATSSLTTEGTASLTVPGASANSTQAGGTGTISAAPSPSANSTASRNFSFTNSDDNRGRGSRTSAGANNSTAFLSTGTGSVVPSTGVPLPSLNSTIPSSLVTGNLSTPSLVPPVSANNTVSPPLVTGNSSMPVATPPASYNATTPPSLVTGNITSLPSVAPTPSSNITTDEACPTEVSFTTRYITIPVIEPVGPTTCVSTGTGGAVLPTANATLPSGTGTGAIPLPIYSTSSTSATASLASAATAISRFRRSEDIATPEQIEAACADPSNIVFNPGFEVQDDNNPLGWSVVPDDSFISFRTFPSEEQHTPDGQLSGRVLSAAAGRKVVVSTPVTLCPGAQYELSSWNRQMDILAQCNLEYKLGDRTVYVTSPQEGWLQRREFYTAGDSPTAVSVDLSVTGICWGQNGATVGEDDAGYMIAEFDDISLVKVDDRKV